MTTEGGYRLFVSADGTVLVRIWDNGLVEAATRPDRHYVWGPPVELVEEP